jgi:hypothetical protein
MEHIGKVMNRIQGDLSRLEVLPPAPELLQTQKRVLAGVPGPFREARITLESVPIEIRQRAHGHRAGIARIAPHPVDFSPFQDLDQLPPGHADKACVQTYQFPLARDLNAGVIAPTRIMSQQIWNAGRMPHGCFHFGNGRGIAHLSKWYNEWYNDFEPNRLVIDF